ncbi:Dynein light chain [Paragonimus heterotremus]|uniref:Dynein light chain n=1 Tax=Paragonimus heterotremus TaxID=100268 RepID=A0A8J4T9A2_9TREM|nr:Dynein light chain [Paragonimus heterotremus]
MERDLKILQTDMDHVMKQEVSRLIVEAFAKHNVERDIASYIKKELDRICFSSWHCIIGKHYGSAFTFQIKCRFYGTLQGRYILIFKC